MTTVISNIYSSIVSLLGNNYSYSQNFLNLYCNPDFTTISKHFEVQKIFEEIISKFNFVHLCLYKELGLHELTASCG